MRTRSGSSLFAAVGAALVFGASSPWAETPVDRGPAVGSTTPGFSLVDQNGERRDLASLLPSESGQLAVIFFRSADW